MTTLITHADSDAGCRLARDLIARGIRVVVTAPQATSLVRIMHGYGTDEVMALAADVDDPNQFAILWRRAEARLGRITAVVDGRDGSGLAAYRDAA